MHILRKIAKNEEAGTINVWYENDLVQYQAIVQDHNNKRFPRRQAKLTPFERNICQDIIEQ